MKKLIYIVVLTTIINITLFAQTNSDSLKFYKNELSVNFVPAVILLSGAEPNSSFPIGHFLYKHSLKNNWYFRANLSVFGNTERPNYSIYTLKSIKNLPTLKIEMEYNIKEMPPYFQLNLGIEKRWGKGIIKQFTGLDIGYHHYNSSNKQMYGIRDSLKDGNPYTYNNGQLVAKSDSIIFQQDKKRNAFILTPFYGVNVNLSKRIFLSAQIGFNIKMSIDNYRTIINNTQNKPELVGKVYNFDVNSNGVSSNMAIGFRF